MLHLKWLQKLASGVAAFVETTVGAAVAAVVLAVVGLVSEVVSGAAVVAFTVVVFATVVVIAAAVGVVGTVVVLLTTVVSFCVVGAAVEVLLEGVAVIGADDELFTGICVVGATVLVLTVVVVVGAAVLLFTSSLVSIDLAAALLLTNSLCSKTNCKNCMKLCVEVFGGMVVSITISSTAGWISMSDFVLGLGVSVVAIGLAVVFSTIFVVGGIGVSICVGLSASTSSKENCVFGSLLLKRLKSL